MSRQLEVLLRQAGLLTDAQLQRCVEQARRRNVPLIDMILKDARVPEEALADAFATHLKLPRVRVAASVADPEALRKVPDRLARKHLCLPLAVEGRVLTLAMANPADYQAIQDVEFASALSVRPVVATRTEIADGIEERYDAEDRIGSFLANVPEVGDLQILSEETADLSVEVLADSRSAAEVAPVVKMCNLVVHDAIKAGASDLHIEPTLHDVQVRMRVDGVLRDYTHVPKWLHSPVVSRLKILAKLDISERRLPQDGRINVQLQGRSIDIRVSTLPTHFGEKVVLRFLGGSTLPMIERMGLNPAQVSVLDGSIRQPQGMILVTGPTGSGKTTTLYAVLAKRRSPEVNIVTVEDPIEYQLPGINQVQINPKAGLSFAAVLRSILRQDPDVILVGELRDQETAEVAFQAAMTGHLVLTTLHTNSAVAAIPRLYDLEVDPSILATSLTLVIAQRLVRRICDQCKEPYTPDAAVEIKVGLAHGEGPVYRGRGCPACGGTGFAGRVGIYEFFRPTNAIRKMITDRASEADLRTAARQAGMRLLREDALDKIKEGVTSPDEVLRVVQVDESEVPCPNCQALIEPDFSTCPYCRHSLKHTCASCGQELKLAWNVCPYCNSIAAIPPLASALDGEPPVAPMPDVPPAPRRPAAARDDSAAADDLWPGLRVIDFDAVNAPPAAAEISDGRGIDLTTATPPAAGSNQGAGQAGASAAGSGHEVRDPGTQAPPAPRPPAPAETPASPPSDFQPRRLRILVVDDDPDIRLVVSMTLRKLRVPVDVITAEDGLDAIRKADENPPDLVVLDLMMPNMDGFETCKRLRESVKTAFVPILMLTASADESSRSRGYLLGTDDYMSKPFLPPDLSLRVTRLIRRTYGM